MPFTDDDHRAQYRASLKEIKQKQSPAEAAAAVRELEGYWRRLITLRCYGGEFRRGMAKAFCIWRSECRKIFGARRAPAKPQRHSVSRPRARQSRPSAACRTGTGGRGAPAPEPEPEAAAPAPFFYPLFSSPDDLPPLDRPDPVIMRQLERSLIRQLVEPRVQAEIRMIARHQPFDSWDARAIDRRLEAAALAADRHPERYGELWLPSLPVPTLALMVRNATWRLWRIAVDVAPATAAEWICWGGRA